MRTLILTLALLTSLCVLAGGLMLSAPALALRAHTFSGAFGEKGTGAGQFTEPEGVAINDATHDVYVADRADNRVEEFTSAGVYIAQFDGSAAPTGPLSSPEEVAVDNSGNPLDPSSEDVYVVDSGHAVVDKFSASGEYLGQIKEAAPGSPFGQVLGVAVDPAGVVWVLQSLPGTNTDKIDSYGNGLVNAFRSEIPPARYNGQRIGHGIAVDSEDNLYLDGNPVEGTLKINSSGEELSQELLTSTSPTGVAVDTSSGNAYIGEGSTVAVFGPNLRIERGTGRGVLLERFGAPRLTRSSGVGVDSSNHTAYVADAGADKVAIFDEVLLPDVLTSERPPVQEHEGSATLEGTVNPDGVPVTSCQFEYGTEPSLGSTAPCEPAPASGSSPVPVHAEVSGLTPLTHYYYRLVAANANGSSAGVEFTFFAAKAPAIEGESFVGVTSNSVTLDAQLNPEGGDTSYRFEYGTTTSYGESISGPAGSAVGDEQVSVHPQDLQPSTTYHFRVVLVSGLATVDGGDETFTTQAQGGEFTLPDGREWEMVTPPDKRGAGLDAVGDEQGADIQAASDGSAITYVSTAPFVADPAGSRTPEATQIFSTRLAPGSWETQDIATPYYEGASNLTLGNGGEYKLFSTDLSLGVVVPNGYTPLPPLPANAEKTMYLRMANGEYRALVTAANIPPGTRLDPPGEPDANTLHFATATPDFSHIIIRSEVPLTAKPGDTGGLYEWAAGQLQKVGVLPNGELTQGELGEVPGNRNDRHAVSDDGSRVIWNASFNTPLYMRDMVKGETIQVDAPQGAPPPTSSASVYRTANRDDSRVFFTSPERLTADSTASREEEDLYEFEVTSSANQPLAGKLNDLTVDPNTGEAARVRGVIGASEDGSYVYFVADGVLGDAAAHHAARGANLYVERYQSASKTWEAPTFVAALSEGDYRSWGGEPGGASTGTGLQIMTSRVSPNGRYLAFMSQESLTGYENRDANSGAPDEEVFLYDTLSGKLICASCDPTGARPTGVLGLPAYFQLADFGATWEGRWFAANIPGWTRLDLNNALYQSRYLSDSGRLFFNSADALVPADVNGQQDVYEYEPAGVGSCQGADHGQSASIVFSASLDGCVGLISSGTSAEESAFMDASEDGGDVFFLTSSRLLAGDRDTSFDLYDAHECTESRPCAPLAGSPPPPCATGDACKPSPSPQPTSFGAPSSETFSGAGNIKQSAPAVVLAPRSLTRAQKLAQALKACRKRDRARRAARVRCESKAKRRYRANDSQVRTSPSAGSGR